MKVTISSPITPSATMKVKDIPTGTIFQSSGTARAGEVLLWMKIYSWGNYVCSLRTDFVVCLTDHRGRVSNVYDYPETEFYNYVPMNVEVKE